VSRDPSTITIHYDGTDITNYVLFSTARFDCQANAMPGGFEFVVKDVDRDLAFLPSGEREFVTGKEVVFRLDGVKLFAGILMQVSQIYALPVVDTSVLSSVMVRQFRLVGVDYNIWFDKRVVRDTDNYKRGINIPGIHWDGEIIRDYLPDFLDVPPGLDMSTYVDNLTKVGKGTKTTGGNQYGLIQQGQPWRSQMEDLAARTASFYYIDGDKNLHYHSVEETVWPYTFVDWRPASAANRASTIGIRAVTASADGAPIVNDALVWGGLEQLADKTGTDPSGTFFSRYKNQDSIDKHGRWQYAEANFQRGDDQDSVDMRAESIVDGLPGSVESGGKPVQQSGLRYPILEISFSWWAHDIPGTQHIKPGQVANILLYVMGSDRQHPMPFILPLRSVSASFPAIPASDGGPAETWCLFTGSFGISYSDSRYLWRFLLQQRRKLQTAAYTAAAVDDDSDSSAFGGFGQFSPQQEPDGNRTAFSIKFPYLPGTAKVYINGLLQRPRLEYAESAPEDGEIAFYTAPYADDVIWVECRTGDGAT
jgi:hypothetical protein